MLLKALLKYQYIPMISFPNRHVEKASVDQSSQQQQTGKMVKLKNIDALNQAIKEQIQRDEAVFLIGDRVSKNKGMPDVGKGLEEQFGQKRIRSSPVSQAGLTGIVCGAALMGLKPIMEYEAMSASLKGIDHIVNSCSKLLYMSGGQLKGGSVVFRGVNGLRLSSESQQSHCFASFYSNIPGLTTVSPYDAEDCRGLLKAAIRSENPVVFLENEYLYEQQFEVPEQALDKDFVLPIGKAKIMREGTDVTIVAHSRSVKFCLEAAEIANKNGIKCEVINLRTLRPLDRDTIVDSVKKTGRLVTVQEGYPQSGIGAEIVAITQQTVAFDYLRGPVQRVTSADVPMPYAQNLQEEVTPRTQAIVKAITKANSFK